MAAKSLCCRGSFVQAGVGEYLLWDRVGPVCSRAVTIHVAFNAARSFVVVWRVEVEAGGAGLEGGGAVLVGGGGV